MLILAAITSCSQQTPYPQRSYEPCQRLESCIILIRNAISNNWKRPDDAYLGLETLVRVRLDDDTNLIEAKVIKSSGSISFDNSTIDAIKKTTPLVELRGLPKKIYNKEFKKFIFTFKPQDLAKKK